MNKRGAEMVEYAIVLACIAAVGVAFYSADFNWGEDGYSWGNLYTIVYNGQIYNANELRKELLEKRFHF